MLPKCVAIDSFSKTSSRVTKIDSGPPRTNPASSEVVVVFATQAWVAISAVASQSLLAWVLGPADRGAYAVCIMFATVLGVLFSFGADRGTQYFVMSKKLPVSNAISVMTWIIGSGSVLAIITGLALMETPIEFFRKADRSSFLVALPLMPLTIFWAAFRLQLAGLRKFVALAKINIIRTSSNIALLLVFVVGMNAGVEGALSAQILCHVIVIPLLITSLRRDDGFRMRAVNLPDIRLVATYGIRYYIARIGHVIDLGMGTLLLAFLATQTELGLFAAASALTFSILMVPQSVEVTLLPRIAGDEAGRPLLVARVARISMMVTATIVILVVAVSEPLVRILLSPEFMGAVPLIRWLAIGVVIQGFGSILMSFFRGNNYPHICSWAVWTGLTVNAIGIFVLYPIIGVSGAAIAMSIGFAGRAVVLVVSFCRVNDIGFLDLVRPTKADARMLRRMIGEITTPGLNRLRNRSR